MNPEVLPYLILVGGVLALAMWRGWIPMPGFMRSAPAPVIRHPKAVDTSPAVAPTVAQSPDPFFFPRDIEQREINDAFAVLERYADRLHSARLGVLLSKVARLEAQAKLDAENAIRFSETAVGFHAAPFAAGAAPAPAPSPSSAPPLSTSSPAVASTAS